MKRILFLLSVTIITTLAYGQDTITFNDGKRLACRITEVDSVTIHFVVKTEGYDVNRYISKEKVKSLSYGGESSLTDSTGPGKSTVEINQMSEADMVVNRIINVMQDNYFFFNGGLVVSTFLGQDARDLGGNLYRTPRFSFNIGAGFITPLSQRVSIQAGLNYTQKGVVFAMENSHLYEPATPGIQVVYSTYQNERVAYRLNYAELPVTIRYTPLTWRSSDDACGYFRFGLVPALRVKAYGEYEINSFAFGWGSEGSYKGDFNGTRALDLGGLLAFGIQRWDHFGFEIGYEIGLRDVMDDQQSNLVFHNSTLMFDFIFYP